MHKIETNIITEFATLELTRVNPDRNIFSINVELTSTFFTLQRFGPSTSLNFKLFFQRTFLAVIDSNGVCSVLPYIVCMDCMYVCCTARCRCLKVGLILGTKRRLQFYKVGLIEAWQSNFS